MKVFVDANVFLRFLVNDDERQAREAEELFVAAKEGKVDLICGPPVLFELAWTLRSAYGRNRTQVLDLLQTILAMGGLKLMDHEAVTVAIEKARDAGTEFADAYIAATAHGAKASLATFNVKDFRDAGVKLRAWS